MNTGVFPTGNVPAPTRDVRRRASPWAVPVPHQSRLQSCFWYRLERAASCYNTPFYTSKDTWAPDLGHCGPALL